MNYRYGDKMETETDIIDNIKEVINQIKENIIDFNCYISLEIGINSLTIGINKVFIYTDMKRIPVNEINTILSIFHEHDYYLEAITSKNKEFKGCLTFEISIN